MATGVGSAVIGGVVDGRSLVSSPYADLSVYSIDNDFHSIYTGSTVTNYAPDDLSCSKEVTNSSDSNQIKPTSAVERQRTINGQTSNEISPKPNPDPSEVEIVDMNVATRNFIGFWYVKL